MGLWTLEERRNEADLIESSNCVKAIHHFHWNVSFTLILTDEREHIQWKFVNLVVTKISENFRQSYLPFVDTLIPHSNGDWLVHWSLMGGLLHMVQRGEAGLGWLRLHPVPLAAPNVTAHPLTASVPTLWCYSMWQYNYNCLVNRWNSLPEDVIIQFSWNKDEILHGLIVCYSDGRILNSCQPTAWDQSWKKPRFFKAMSNSPAWDRCLNQPLTAYGIATLSRTECCSFCPIETVGLITLIDPAAPFSQTRRAGWQWWVGPQTAHYLYGLLFHRHSCAILRQCSRYRYRSRCWHSRVPRSSTRRTRATCLVGR